MDFIRLYLHISEEIYSFSVDEIINFGSLTTQDLTKVIRIRQNMQRTYSVKSQHNYVCIWIYMFGTM